MRDLKVVESMKDFYWDIRPKPEFGTIEIRVCDTPLTIEKAAALAAYAQALARHLMLDRPSAPSLDVYRVYSFNRFTRLPLWTGGRLHRRVVAHAPGVTGRHRGNAGAPGSPCAGAGFRPRRSR